MGSLHRVMPGPVPGIHVLALFQRRERRRWPGQARPWRKLDQLVRDHASSSAQRAAFAANFAERFSLLPRQPAVLSTGFFAVCGFEPSLPYPPTASVAAWAASNQAEAVGFASVRRMMIQI